MIPPELKAARARQKLLDKAKEMSTSKYSAKYVAPLFHKMIRAEAAADQMRFAIAVVNGKVQNVARRIGECVCCTCGAVHRWDSGQHGMHTGHFVAVGSGGNSVRYEESNVAPQCCSCNIFGHSSPQNYRLWMEAVRGAAEIERLERLKPQSRQFSREELVDMRIEYAARLKAAIERMKA